MSEKTVKYVTMGMYIATISFIFSVMSYLLYANSANSARVDNAVNEYKQKTDEYIKKEDITQKTLSSIDSRNARIETNIEWIMKSLNK